MRVPSGNSVRMRVEFGWPIVAYMRVIVKPRRQCEFGHFLACHTDARAHTRQCRAMQNMVIGVTNHTWPNVRSSARAQTQRLAWACTCSCQYVRACRLLADRQRRDLALPLCCARCFSIILVGFIVVVFVLVSTPACWYSFVSSTIICNGYCTLGQPTGDAPRCMRSFAVLLIDRLIIRSPPTRWLARSFAQLTFA